MKTWKLTVLLSCMLVLLVSALFWSYIFFGVFIAGVGTVNVSYPLSLLVLFVVLGIALVNWGLLLSVMRELSNMPSGVKQ